MKRTLVTHTPQVRPVKIFPQGLGMKYRHTPLLAGVAFAISYGMAAMTLLAAEPQLQPSTNSLSQPIQLSEESTGKVQPNDVGEGFPSGSQSISLEAGAVNGFAILGGHQRHDLALTSLSYGHMLGPVRGDDHWYRGNWELRGELFGGPQFSPTANYVIGLAPHLRYDFATGSRWVPFVDLGAGVTATGIGAPDLSGTFEFNLQGGAGLHYFIRNNLAVTAETHYLHLSCGGINSPNLGLNGVAGMIGLSWFF
jgi:hypothetical protein